MTAMSATSAHETPSNANPFPDLASADAGLRTVLLPGSPATYANRAALREMGLRWDPANHRWHGTTTPEQVRTLREQLGLEVRCFGSLDIPVAPNGPTAPRPVAPRPSPAPVTPALTARPRVHDGSRTHLESRIAFPGAQGGEDEFPTPTRRFSLLEITSGLPDDSREEDERTSVRALRDLRGRVKAARAVVSTSPGLAEILSADWQKAARFYTLFAITESQFRHGVRDLPSDEPDNLVKDSPSTVPLREIPLGV